MFPSHDLDGGKELSVNDIILEARDTTGGVGVSLVSQANDGLTWQFGRTTTGTNITDGIVFGNGFLQVYGSSAIEYQFSPTGIDMNDNDLTEIGTLKADRNSPSGTIYLELCDDTVPQGLIGVSRNTDMASAYLGWSNSCGTSNLNRTGFTFANGSISVDVGGTNLGSVFVEQGMRVKTTAGITASTTQTQGQGALSSNLN